MTLVDSHCHLADPAFIDDLPAVVERARARGVTGGLCILSADEPDELARAADVARLWPGVQFAAAIHPHRAGAFAGRVAEAAAVTGRALEAVSGVAVGEMGLDYHYDLAPRDVQQAVFGAQAALAVAHGRPIVVHTRDAFDDTLAIIRDTAGLSGVLHCFTGTVDEARQALDLGFYVSLAGIVTFPKAQGLRDLARFMPADRLLVETDAPYLAPVPFRGTRNEPAHVVETLQAVADARGEAPDVVAEIVCRNFAALLGGAATRLAR